MTLDTKIAAKTLRDASREQVENFIRQLADWAVKVGGALVRQLDSYVHRFRRANLSGPAWLHTHSC